MWKKENALDIFGHNQSLTGQRSLEHGGGVEATLGFLSIWVGCCNDIYFPKLLVDLEMASVI